MSDSLEKPWSSSPNAPQIPLSVYVQEKELFAAFVVGGTLYGISVILFFQCIGALINPANDTRRGVKFGLIAYTTALFSFSTISLAFGRDMLSIIFIDIRNFPGTEEYPPGPIGSAIIFGFNAADVVLINFPGFANQWLSDGLLLYRCYVIYGMNYWAIALPSLIYAASIGAGIASVYFNTIFDANTTLISLHIGSLYYAICLTLNILLTFMIITKLILHRRNLQDALGASNATARVYTTVVIMLVESYALYAVAVLSNVVTWALQSVGLDVTVKILSNVQVIAPYLIVLRVAERRALTSEMISGSTNIGSIRFRSQGTSDGVGSLPDGDPSDSMQVNGGAPREVGAIAKISIEEVPL